MNLGDLNSERIFEYAAVLRDIPPKTETILDVGCCESKFSIVLASLGFRVTGIDQRRYSPRHPFFSFVQCNVMELPFEDKSFDLAVAVSTIEHVGIGFYGDPIDDDGVIKSINELKRVSVHQIYTLPTPLKKTSFPEVLKTPDEWGEICGCSHIEYFTTSGDGFWFPSLKVKAPESEIQDKEAAHIIVLVS